MTKLTIINNKLAFTRNGSTMMFPFTWVQNDIDGQVTINDVSSERSFTVDLADFVDSGDVPISPSSLLDLLSSYCYTESTSTVEVTTTTPLDVTLTNDPLEIKNPNNSSNGSLRFITDSVDLQPLGASSAIVHIFGTFTGTLVFEVSQNASNWLPALAIPAFGVNQTTVSSTTVPGAWLIDVAGWVYFRVKFSSVTSGIANVFTSMTNGTVISRSVFSGQSSLPVTGPLTNSELRLTPVPVNSPGVSVTNTMSSLNSFVQLATSGNSGVVFDIRGTFIGTITFQATIDGTNWINVTAIPYGTGPNVAGVQTTTAPGAWLINCMGALTVRAIFTAFTSGTATVVIRIVQDSSITANYNTGATTLPVSGTIIANQGAMVALPAGTNLVGDLGVQYRNVATGAASVTPINSPATPAGQSIKATAGRALMFYGVNTSAGTLFLKVFNVASVTMGVTSASYEIPLPPGSNAVPISLEGGFEATAAIVIAITGARGLTDNTVITANSVTGFVAFK